MLPGKVLLALCERSPKRRLGPDSAWIVKVCSDFLVSMTYTRLAWRGVGNLEQFSVVRSWGCADGEPNELIETT